MKVFGIGLPRTGTLSLSHAIASLGMRSIHYVGLDKLFDGVDLLDADDGRFDIADAFVDFPVFLYWPKLVKLFPDAKFVMTLRSDVEAWIDSLMLHVLCERRFNEEPTWRDIDTRMWRTVYKEHTSEVIDVLSDRCRLAVITDTMSDSDKWSALSGLLGVEVPLYRKWPVSNTSIEKINKLQISYERRYRAGRPVA